MFQYCIVQLTTFKRMSSMFLWWLKVVVFFLKIDLISDPMGNKHSFDHYYHQNIVKGETGNLIVPFACCLQVTALSTLGFMSPWAGGHTDATVTTDTDTGRGPRRGTLQLMMEENPPHTVGSPCPDSTAIGSLHVVIKELLTLSFCNSFVLFAAADTPAQRVQFLLGTEDGDEEHIPHALFTELDEICLREGEDAEWKETARYTYSGSGSLSNRVFDNDCSFITDSFRAVTYYKFNLILNYYSKVVKNRKLISCFLFGETVSLLYIYWWYRCIISVFLSVQVVEVWGGCWGWWWAME